MSHNNFKILIDWLEDKAQHYQKMGFKNLPEIYRKRIERLKKYNDAKDKKHTASAKDQA